MIERIWEIDNSIYSWSAKWIWDLAEEMEIDKWKGDVIDGSAVVGW